MPIAWLLWIALTLALAIALWPWIMQLMAKHVIPFVRRRLGAQVADRLASLVGWIDDRVCLTRQQVMDGWRALTENGLGIVTTYSQLTPASVRAVSELSVTDQATETHEEVIPWEKLNGDLRRQIGRSKSREAALDVRKAIEERTREAVEKHKLSLEL